MVDLGKSRALVRTGATVMLTLSMTVGSVPLNGFAAYAQEVSASQEAAAAVEKTPDGFYLEKGRAYEVPVALKKDDGTPSMAAGYFEKNGTVTWDGSKYTVTFTITKDGQGFVTAIPNAQSLGNGSYSVTADSLKESIKLDFKITVPVIGAMDQSGYLHVDTAGLDTSAPVTVDKSELTSAIAEAKKVEQGNKTDDAYKTLQDAIAAAQKVADDDAADQDAVDKAVETLNAAVKAFNDSADKPSQDGFKPVEGHTYEIPLKLDESGQYASYFHNYSGSFDGVKPAVVTYKGGVYTVQITLGNAAAINGVLIGKKEAKQVSSDGVVTTYEVELDSLDDTTITLSAFFGSPEGPLGFDTANAKDTSAPTPSVPDPYESSYQVYYKGSDASQQYVGKSFQSKVKVVPQADGSYIVELTANSLGDAGKLADVKVAGEAVAYTDNADGSRTYKIPMSDLKATLDFTFGYTVTFNGQSRTMEHPFQLVLDGAEYAGPTATTSFLVEQIAKAKSELAAGEKKPQAAKDALQKAIDDAQAVADDANATDRERGDAMKAVVDATAAFKATPDVTVPDPYESDYQIYYKGSDATADYVGRSFQSKVKVVPQADGSYIVELTANSLGNAGKLADVKVDGTAVAYTDNLDGSRTYKIPVADVKGTTDFTFGYTVTFNGQSRTMEHPFQLVLAGGSYTGYTATVEFLNAQVKSAEGTLAAGEKKPQAAKDALQKAIDDAKAVAAKADATPAERGDAVKALDAAVKAFKATADETEPEGGLVAGKTYTVPMGLYQDEAGTTPSMAAGMLDSNATVVKEADGTYTVTAVVKHSEGETSFVFLGLKIADVDATRAFAENGDQIYTVKGIKSIDGAVKVQFHYYVPSINMDHSPEAYAKFDVTKAVEGQAPAASDAVNKDSLKAILDYAKTLEQGKKSDEAWEALQAAVKTAETVYGNDQVPQAGVDAVVTKTIKAVQDFKASADVETPTVSESAFQIYYKGEVSDRFAGSFNDKVKVVPQEDGTYVLELTAKSLGSAATLGDVTVGGKAVQYVDNADGSRTYQLPVQDVKGTVNFTFSYTISAAKRVNVHPFQLVLDGGEYAGIAGFVDEQVTVAEDALKNGENKTDDAKAALQQAIDGAKAAKTDADRATALNTLVSAIHTFNASADKPDQTKVDKSELTSAIDAAKKLAQGNKTEDAYKTLQSAIAAAQKVADDANADQATVDKAVETLNAAVKAFKDSADKPSDKTMVAGKEYTVAAQLQKEDGSASMAADFFEKTATVVWDGAKSYKVTFTVTADGVQYIKGIVGKDAAVTDLGGGKYAVTVESLANRIALTFSLSVPGIPSMEQTGYLWLDTKSLPGLPEQQKPETKPETKPNTNQNPKGDENEEGFQVGHTYQVPIAFKKSGSSETSMAAQYFGDTALVRPQSDGTFKVSFSTNKPEWISALTFNGATVTRNGSEYTLTIPAATADQVLQLGLTIKPMGDKAVTTDLHLYLSQAKDLGTGKDGVASSSDKVLPQTGDAQQAVIAGTALAGIAAIAAAEAIRRRKRAE